MYVCGGIGMDSMTQQNTKKNLHSNDHPTGTCILCMCTHNIFTVKLNLHTCMHI